MSSCAFRGIRFPMMVRWSSKFGRSTFRVPWSCVVDVEGVCTASGLGGESFPWLS